MRLYGYLGLALIIFAEINFRLVIEPFASWYIPIVWWGFILFVDSLVYKVKKRSLISSYPKEFIFLAIISVGFWTIFEVYNLFLHNWYYLHYIWYVHPIDFTVIMPSFIETYSLFNVLEIGKRFDVKKKIKSLSKRGKEIGQSIYLNIVKLLIPIGALVAVVPILVPSISFGITWFGLILLLDPLNYVTGRYSIIEKLSLGKKSVAVKIIGAGLVTGFFYEFWNYQAYPKWFYSLPKYLSQIKLFEMPLPGYIGYVAFMAETLLFFALVRSFVFKGGNDVLSI